MLVFPYPRKICRKPAGFSPPILVQLSSLDQDTIDAHSLNCFKNRLDKIMSTRMGFFMDYKMSGFVIKVKVKEVYLYIAFIVVPHTQGAQVRITQCYLQITPYLPLPRKHSPDGASPD